MFQILDSIFLPLLSLPPFLSLLAISFIVTSLSFLFNKLVFREKTLKEMRKRMEEIRENVVKLQKEGKYEELSECFKEMMQVNKTYLKHTSKTLIFSLLIFILFFPWIKYRFEGYATIAKLPFSLPFIGAQLDWLKWYILSSFVVALILKKMLGE